VIRGINALINIYYIHYSLGVNPKYLFCKTKGRCDLKELELNLSIYPNLD